MDPRAASGDIGPALTKRVINGLGQLLNTTNARELIQA